MSAPGIAIVGAGIGGLTTALALQGKGLSVTVFEGAPVLKPVGAGIILASNAMQVLHKLGLADELTRHGQSVSVLKITDAQLRPLSVADLSGFEEKYRVKNLAIHRGALQRVLAEAVGRERIHLGKRLAAIEPGSPYQLRFEDESTHAAEYIIGADGIKSVVRASVVAQAPIRPANQLCWRGIGALDLPERYAHELTEAWGVGERFGFVQIGPGQVYWYALSTTKTAPDADLPHLFRRFHPDVLAILGATPTAQIHVSEIADLRPLSTWQHRGVCLLGDAAHATTPNLGQGAGQAMEDAYVLGLCVEREANVPQAFRRYEQLRRGKADAVVKSSWQIGQLAQLDSRVGAWCRNQVMRRLPSAFSRRQLQMLFSLEYAK